MRIMSPVVDNSALTPDLAVRLMQANFDSALDARYAIAKGKLWSVFIHPLSPLTDKELKSGLHQVVTLVRSYGGSFSSGGLQFGGGDSRNSVTEDKPRELEPL